MNWICNRLVSNWRDATKWASMRLHMVAVLIAGLYSVMPVLDPSIAAMLPAPLVAKAIGGYALIGALLRVVQLKKPGG